MCIIYVYTHIEAIKKNIYVYYVGLGVYEL